VKQILWKTRTYFCGDAVSSNLPMPNLTRCFNQGIVLLGTHISTALAG